MSRESQNWIRVGVVYYFYCVIVGLGIQWVLLPYIFPAWHAGDGLLIQGDWLSRHEEAKIIAQTILEKGWGSWSLRPPPFYHVETGAVSALYVLCGAKPWVVVFLTAFLHAAGALVLTAILRGYFAFHTAVLAALPFLLFPSSLIWVAMIRKDGASNLGCLLFIFGWVLVLKKRLPLWGALVSFLGIGLAWLIRPYMGQILLLFNFLFLFGWMIQSKMRAFPYVLALVGFYLLMVPVLSRGGQFVTTPAFDEKYETKPPVHTESRFAPIEDWKKTSGIPVSIERKFYTLSLSRQGFLQEYPGAQAIVDKEIIFDSIGSIVAYVPRALTVGLFYPLPRHWIGKGSNAATSSFRKIAGVEMIASIIGLLFFLIFLWKNPRDLSVWYVLFFCLGYICLYTITVPNWGVIHRMRYPFMMLLVAFGIGQLDQVMKISGKYLAFLPLIRARFRNRKRRGAFAAESGT